MSFERHTRRKLKNHHSEVDTDALWNSIQNDIPNEKEKKRRGLFFLFFGFAVMGGIIALYYNPAVRHQLANYIAPLKIQPDQTALLAEDVFYEKQMYLLAETDMDVPFYSPEFTFSTSTIQESNTNQRIKNEVLNFQSIFEQDLTTKAQAETILEVKTPIVEEKSVIAKEDKMLYLSSIPTLYGLVEFILEEETLIAVLDEPIDEKEETEETKKKEASSKKSGVALGFSSSYAVSNAQIESKSSSDRFFARKRNLSESAVSTFSLDGNVVFSFKKNIQLRTGLSYTRISERFISRRFSSSQNNNQSNNTDPSSGDGDVLNSVGLASNSVQQNSGSNYQRPTSTATIDKFSSINTHQMLDIPLVLGYKIGNNKISFLVESGAYINLASRSKGYTMTQYGSYEKIDQQENRFKKNILLTTYAGLSSTFNINDLTFLKVGVQHRYTPFSITEKNNILNQKYHSVGIHMGVFKTIK